MARDSAAAANIHIRVPSEEDTQQKAAPPQGAATPSTPELRNRMGVNSPRLKTKDERQLTRNGTESQYREDEDYDYEDGYEYEEDGYDGEAGATTHGYHQQPGAGYANNQGAPDGLSGLVTQVARPDPNAKRSAVPPPRAPQQGMRSKKPRPQRPAGQEQAASKGAKGETENADQPSKKRLTGLARLCSCFMPTRSKKEMEAEVHEAEAEMAPAADMDNRSSRRSSASSVDDPYGDSLLPPRSPENRQKKTLVLDLDETLVHSSFKPVPNPDFIVPITIDNNVHQVYVMKRPGVDEFMQKVCQKYEVILFTASLSKYANPLLDILDPACTIDARLFREACVMHCGTYVKDLSLLGRKLRSTIIVDNSPQSYSFHPSNAVPIDSWFDDRSDQQLYDLLPLLSYLADVHDVRDVLDANKPIDWLLHEFNEKHGEKYAPHAHPQHPMNGMSMSRTGMTMTGSLTGSRTGVSMTGSRAQ